MKGIQNCSLYIYPLYYCTVLYIYLEVEYKGDEELYTVHLTPVLLYCTVLYIYLEVEYEGDTELYTVHLTPCTTVLYCIFI